MSKIPWPGRLLRRRNARAGDRTGPAPAGRPGRRPSPLLRELEQAQADLRARLALLSRRLDALPALEPEERAALRRAGTEIRDRLAAASRRLAMFRKRCWWVILVQLCLLAAMLAAFAFLPELQGA